MADAVNIVTAQGYINIVLDVTGLNSHGLSIGFACKAVEVHLRRIGLNHTHWRLDADNHLLVAVEGVSTAIREGVHRAPVVTVAAPTKVDVIFVKARVISVNIECVTASTWVYCHVYYRTTLGHLGLKQIGPVCITVT